MSRNRRPWAVLFGCFCMAAGFNAYLIAPASIIPLLVDSFGIDKASAGLSISVFFLAWGMAGLPGGLLMDRYDNRRLTFVGVVALVLASLAGAATSAYLPFLLTRFVGGATGAFLWTANANVVSRVFPESKLAVATGLFVAAGPAGQAIAQFGGPLLADVAGWRAVFVVYPLIVVAGLPVLYLAAREPVRSEEAISLGQFVRVLRNPTILAVSFASACSFALFVFFSSWMPTYATEELSIDLAAAGAATALVPFAGIVARPGGGWLSDRIGERRRPVIVVSFLLALPVIFGVTTIRSAGGFAVLMLAAGASVQLAIGVYYVYVAELAEPGTTGTCLAMVTSVSTVGSLIAPALAGWLIDVSSWTAGYGFAVVVALAGIGFVLSTPES